MIEIEDLSPDAALAALAWQVDLGVSEVISEAPINRYEDPAPIAPTAAEKQPSAVHQAPPQTPQTPKDQGSSEPALASLVKTANAMAAAATDLKGLRQALAGFEGCEIKKGARNLVFADGNPLARVMIIGEAPGRDEDREGKPFVGKAGQLLDNMFGAIGHSRQGETPQDALYITNVLTWRPPQNRDPQADEIAMMLPFLKRHIALADPEVLVLMGNSACAALLGKTGITRLRGQWTKVAGKPTLPMFHPAYLLRHPVDKRLAWADLKALRNQLKEPS